MKHLMKIGSGVNVLPLALDLKRQPELWNTRPARTDYEGSPHKDADDIWVRFAEGSEGGVRPPDGPHTSVWYPEYRKLPRVRDIVFGVMGLVQGEQLGGVLITRIPPGKSVLPHVDSGWHAEYYDKFAVQIESHQQQSFNFEDGSFVAAPGDIYWFDNSKEHWVVNDSPVDRITMILNIRTDRFQDLRT